MIVSLLYFDDCPNWKDAEARLETLKAEIEGLEITTTIVDTPELATKHNFRGSPTVLIDGTDPFASDTDPTGLACRIYNTPTGPAGSPSLDQLRTAITTADRSQ